MNTSQAITAFEKAFFWDSGDQDDGAGRKSTWTGAYLPYLRKLDSLAGSEPICIDALAKSLAQYKAGTRSYQLCRQAYCQLARSAGIAIPDRWGFIESDWHAQDIGIERQPVADEEIVPGVNAITNARWRLVCALMCIYGLRNYEALFCDVSQLRIAGTGALVVPEIANIPAKVITPCTHDWLHVFGVEQLASERIPLPRVSTDLTKTTLQQIGRRAAEQFRRYGCPFTPSDLRHSWTVRAIRVGTPATVVAKMMGVDIAFLVKGYRSWIDEKDREYLETLDPVRVVA